MVARLLLAAGIFLKPTAGGDVCFVADDGIDAGCLGGTVKLQRSMQITVVGDRQSIHAQGNGAIDQAFD